MKNIPFYQRHHHETRFIRIRSRQCQSCWECVKVCPENVLAEMNHFHHSHVRIVNPEACNGCKKCVRACAYGAIEYTYVPKSARASDKASPGEDAKGMESRN